jgi:Mg2+ and Co2+ transporter CorA
VRKEFAGVFLQHIQLVANKEVADDKVALFAGVCTEEQLLLVEVVDCAQSFRRKIDMVEDYGELIEGLSKTFDSLQTNKTNEIMKVLTFLSTIMLPLTVVSSIYGMNVVLPFQKSPFIFIGIVIAMLIIVIAFFIYFKRRKWL